MKHHAMVGKILATMLFCAGMSLSAAAQGVGAIGGTVTDSSGAALPGVTVALVTPGVIGGSQETVTDGRGAYQFVRLIPATYSVRVSLIGFRTSVQQGIVVNADVTARVEIMTIIDRMIEFAG